MGRKHLNVSLILSGLVLLLASSFIARCMKTEGINALGEAKISKEVCNIKLRTRTDHTSK